jgi:hypothetical protein
MVYGTNDTTFLDTFFFINISYPNYSTNLSNGLVSFKMGANGIRYISLMTGTTIYSHASFQTSNAFPQQGGQKIV